MRYSLAINVTYSEDNRVFRIFINQLKRIIPSLIIQFANLKGSNVQAFQIFICKVIFQIKQWENFRARNCLVKLGYKSSFPGTESDNTVNDNNARSEHKRFVSNT